MGDVLSPIPLWSGLALLVAALLPLAVLAADGAGEAPTTPETDRQALIALYNATDGEDWRNSDNWLTVRSARWPPRPELASPETS